MKKKRSLCGDFGMHTKIAECTVLVKLMWSCPIVVMCELGLAWQSDGELQEMQKKSSSMAQHHAM